MENIKIKNALVKSAVSIEGTKVAGDYTLNASKQPGIRMEYDPNSQLLVVYIKDQIGLVPASNIIRMIVEE